GRGFSPAEYACFGRDMADSRALTEEALAILRLAFHGAPVSFTGRHFTLDNVDIVPKVIQQPHPPLWSAAVSPESFERAARQGVGVLIGPFKPWFMIKEDIRRYREHWRRHHGDGPTAPGQNPRVGMTLGIFCLEDAERARALAREGLTWAYRALFKQTLPVLEKLYAGYEYYRRLGSLRGLIGKAITLPALETLGMAVVGDPPHCIRRLEALHAAGVDHVLCTVGGGVLPTEQVRESLRVLGERVLPHFREPPP
ncbi:MAG: LLM class flavin-dependent oxidoreductase, partial [Gammaproteobacteria bacterium]|nr:LLM class flavin-dependent oxidoreductase [Gammaproteobacteria bacterium]